ncbi:methyltransferase domain-containing protein [Verrucomicrobiota bacterium sgz303538]
MAIDCRPIAGISSTQLADLEAKMAGFYQHPPKSYYLVAEQSANNYQPDHLPFHSDLVGQTTPGMRIIEFGCGTAHLCPEVEKRGGHYTGVDWSELLLAENRRRFPQADFFSVQNPPAGTFDLVASLYTIEHLVNPVGYLEQLWAHCRPGGLVGIICPEFIDGRELAPSLFYGRTPRRIREKLSTGNLLDAVLHVTDLKITAPRLKQNARASAPGSFWINLKPRVLYGSPFSIDADAVYLARLQDLVWWFEKSGAKIIKTSRTMPGIAADVLAFNCYVLAQKPAEVQAVN